LQLGVRPRSAALLATGIAVAFSLIGSAWLLAHGITRGPVGPVADAGAQATPGVAASLGPTATPMVLVLNPRTSPDSFQAGVTVIAYGTDPEFAEKVGKLLDHLARQGVNSVALMVPIFQDGWTASSVYADAQLTPTVDTVRTFIREAADRDFTVALRPILDEKRLGGAHWRGDIRPSNRAAWFRSYTQLLLQYARVAKDEQADIFSVGTEFNSLQPDTADWLQIIAAVRSVFTGSVTYAANYNAPTIGFATALDFVSVDAFFPLAAPVGATTDQLVRAWQAWIPTLAQMQRVTGKPVVLSELGVTSEAGSYRTPYVWHHFSGLSLQAQAAYYEASCSALKSQVAGIYWWEYDLNPPASPLTDPGFDPFGKPAEAQVRDCFQPAPGTIHPSNPRRNP
jgi:glycosyl hydrolase family 113